jgi:hypothetical protein
MDHRAGLAGAITGSQPDPRPWLRAPDSRSRDRRGAADRLGAWRAREREPLAQGGPPSRRLQRVTLDLPLGSHLEPLPREAEVSAPALADLLADALDALDLDAATVVGNDTGGALTQILATRRPERAAPSCSPPATPSTTSHRVSFASCSHRRASRAPFRSPSRPYNCVRRGACRSRTGGSRRNRSTAMPRTRMCFLCSLGERCGATCGGSFRASTQAIRSTPPSSS